MTYNLYLLLLFPGIGVSCGEGMEAEVCIYFRHGICVASHSCVYQIMVLNDSAVAVAYRGVCLTFSH